MRYLVEMDGTIELDATDETTAEDMAMDYIHGDIAAIVNAGDIDINFTILDVKELD